MYMYFTYKYTLHISGYMCSLYEIWKFPIMLVVTKDVVGYRNEKKAICDVALHIQIQS